ncbi:hypothetical protein ACTMU2_17455 [Cupriavidus basilensis]
MAAMVHGRNRQWQRFGSSQFFSDATVKSYLTNDPNALVSRTVKLEFEPSCIVHHGGTWLNSATNADSTLFVSHGGKLLLWHGTTDNGA